MDKRIGYSEQSVVAPIIRHISFTFVARESQISLEL